MNYKFNTNYIYAYLKTIFILIFFGNIAYADECNTELQVNDEQTIEWSGWQKANRRFKKHPKISNKKTSKYIDNKSIKGTGQLMTEQNFLEIAEIDSLTTDNISDWRQSMFNRKFLEKSKKLLPNWKVLKKLNPDQERIFLISTGEKLILNDFDKDDGLIDALFKSSYDQPRIDLGIVGQIFYAIKMEISNDKKSITLTSIEDGETITVKFKKILRYVDADDIRHKIKE